MLARNASKALARLFPEHASTFEANLQRFEDRINEAYYGPDLVHLVGAKRLDRAVLSGRLFSLLDKKFKGAKLGDRAAGWLKKARALRGLTLVEYHKVWAYFAQAFGFSLVGTVESYPGIRPGPGHIQSLIEMMKRKHVPLILVDNFYAKDLPEHVAKKAGAAYVMLPDQVGGEPDVQNYFQLIDRVLDEILAKLPKAQETSP
jgi:ABC-type Zn uptake system ZnuABC Zn-binding protein ZnuA